MFMLCIENYKNTYTCDLVKCLFQQEEIDEHKASLDPCNPRDLIDAYLLKMAETADDDFRNGL